MPGSRARLGSYAQAGALNPTASGAGEPTSKAAQAPRWLSWVTDVALGKAPRGMRSAWVREPLSPVRALWPCSRAGGLSESSKGPWTVLGLPCRGDARGAGGHPSALAEQGCLAEVPRHHPDMPGSLLSVQPFLGVRLWLMGSSWAAGTPAGWSTGCRDATRAGEAGSSLGAVQRSARTEGWAPQMSDRVEM